MTLWLVLLIHGTVQGVWGPLPPDMNACFQQAQVVFDQVQTQGRKGVTVGCRLTNDPPKIGDREI